MKRTYSQGVGLKFEQKFGQVGSHSSGRRAYSGCHQLLIESDSGGANGHRNWLWKVGLQALANEFGLTITVTHNTTSASKWNPVEHLTQAQLHDSTTNRRPVKNVKLFPDKD